MKQARPSGCTSLILRAAVVLAALVLSPAAMAADDAGGCKLNPLGTMPITFSGYWLMPTIQGNINDVPTSALIDVSAPNSVLDKRFLDLIGVPVLDKGERVFGLGTERFRLYQARVRKLQVGPSSGSGVFEVWDTTDAEFGIRVGTDFLFQFDMELALADKQVRFFKPEGCKNIALAYWDGASTSVPFFTDSDEDLRPRLTVKINGKELPAMISTSMEDSLLDLGAAKSLGITPQSPDVAQARRIKTGSSEVLPTWIAPLDTLEIGGEKISKLKVKMSNLGGASRGIILGLDFLRAHRILVSMSQRELYLTYLGGKLFNVADEGERPWYTAEAERGNADAQFRLSQVLDRKDGSPSDRARSLEWLGKAAAQGHQRALSTLAVSEFSAARFADSARYFAQLRKANTRLPGDVAWTYLASARGGDPAAALQQLKRERPAGQRREWDDNVLDFHLGLIDEAALLKLADKNPQREFHICDASFHVAEAYLIAGTFDLARGALNAAENFCNADGARKGIIAAELARLTAVPRS